MRGRRGTKKITKPNQNCGEKIGPSEYYSLITSEGTKLVLAKYLVSAKTCQNFHEEMTQNISLPPTLIIFVEY